MSNKNCTSCNAPLAEQGATEFKCPVCEQKIYRCFRCREQSIPYICAKCGFRGP
ncbi:LSD1 subclass zinc finger protein [Methanolinea mesophila]|jgi:LSD1 subclass zinc finger protein|uniref:zinc finger domain-containing protein n=1 Tax=Methanolinea mesophila TaxID=547055 RepID=UPI001AE8F1E2|nr:zinc finger domain-containing protein [Methanolinea mesophila]MBP1928572.1 LSD1 subclass zinc finger protein [Methanolinea mesophila]